MSWITYTNGNYKVFLNTDNGTKIRYNNQTFFAPNRPESMDVKITNCCHYNCKYCHEGSTPMGNLATLTDVTNFVATLPPYTPLIRSRRRPQNRNSVFVNGSRSNSCWTRTERPSIPFRRSVYPQAM